MSFLSSTDDQRRDGDCLASKLPGAPGVVEAPTTFKRLRSFIYEVTAGRPMGVGDATPTDELSAPSEEKARRVAVLSGISEVELPASAKRHAAREARRPRGRARKLAGAAPPPMELPEQASPSEANVTPMPSVSSPVHQSVPADAPRRRALPAWFASLSVHGTLIALLTTVSIAAVEAPQELEMYFAPATAEFEEVAFNEPSLDPAADIGAIVADDLPAELIDPGQAAFGGFSAEGDLGTGLDVPGDTAPAGTPGGGGPLGEIGSMLGVEGGTGTGAFGSGLGGAPTAKFFGAEIAGRRIVFVLDNSGSMQGGRLETVIAELLNCLDRLREDQEFYVIFHSDVVYPMLYPDSIDRYLRPTKANKQLVAEWLDTVELCLGDSVEDAIIAAASIEPDTVFLLSDGRVQGENKFRILLNAGSRNFPIHTFAVGMNGSVAGRKNLQMIADANGGDFTESEISPEMRDLSRRQLRPYHNETPGPVWGRNVKPFKKF
jgi:hypothetical protein